MMIERNVGTLVLAIIAIVCLATMCCGLLARAVRIAGAIRITMTVLYTHMLVSTVVLVIFGLYALDAQAYDTMAVEIAGQLTGHAFEPINTAPGKEGWVWLLGWIYHLIGHFPIVGLLLNSMLASAVVPIVGLITTRLGYESAARTAMWIAGFAPPLFIWSTFLLREPAINLSLSVALAGCVQYLSSRRMRWLCLTLLAGTALYWFRGPLVAVLVVGLVVGLIMSAKLGTSRMRPTRAILLVVVTVIAIPIMFAVLKNFNVSLHSISVARAALARTANSSFGEVSATPGLAGTIRVALSQLPRALLGPFPWQWSGGLGGALFAADALTWWLFAYAIARAWRMVPLRRGRWILAAPAVVLFLAIAATSGNYGTLVRIRGMEVPLLAPLIAAGLMRRRTYSRQGKHDLAGKRRVKLESRSATGAMLPSPAASYRTETRDARIAGNFGVHMGQHLTTLRSGVPREQLSVVARESRPIHDSAG